MVSRDFVLFLLVNGGEMNGIFELSVDANFSSFFQAFCISLKI